MMSNEELAKNVTDELYWDPKVHSSSIAVSSDGGAVTLRGTVGSFREKREAKKAAERVYGVTSVENELNVHLMTDGARSDADVRADVLQAIDRIARAPPELLDYIRKLLSETKGGG
jgi:hypothetical protein